MRWIGNLAVLDPRPDGEFTLASNGVPVALLRRVYVPLEVMPEGVRTVSGYTPSGAAVQALSAS